MDMSNESILNKAAEMFYREGIRKTTMDKLSGELGISKKTLYERFPDKEALLNAMLERRSRQLGHRIQEINDDASLNAIETFYRVGKTVNEAYMNVSEVFMTDIQKYKPQVWEEARAFHRRQTIARLVDNYKQGVKEGLYRPGVDSETFSHYYLLLMEHLVKGDLSKLLSKGPAKAYDDLFSYHIRSITSEKGLEYIDSNIIKTKK